MVINMKELLFYFRPNMFLRLFVKTKNPKSGNNWDGKYYAMKESLRKSNKE